MQGCRSPRMVEIVTSRAEAALTKNIYYLDYTMWEGWRIDGSACTEGEGQGSWPFTHEGGAPYQCAAQRSNSRARARSGDPRVAHPRVFRRHHAGDPGGCLDEPRSPAA